MPLLRGGAPFRFPVLDRSRATIGLEKSPDIYFPDTEGGKRPTMFVSPGTIMMGDTGVPGNRGGHAWLNQMIRASTRDADRIMTVEAGQCGPRLRSDQALHGIMPEMTAESLIGSPLGISRIRHAHPSRCRRGGCYLPSMRLFESMGRNK